MKLGVIFTGIFVVIASAYFSAKNSLQSKIQLSVLRLQMTEQDLQKKIWRTILT